MNKLIDWRTYLDHVADLEVKHVAGHVSLRVYLDNQVEMPLLEAKQEGKKEQKATEENRLTTEGKEKKLAPTSHQNLTAGGGGGDFALFINFVRGRQKQNLPAPALHLHNSFHVAAQISFFAGFLPAMAVLECITYVRHNDGRKSKSVPRYMEDVKTCTGRIRRT